MSAATQTASRPQSDARPRQERARGPVGTLFGFALGLVLTLLGSWLMATVIEIVGMYTLWPEQRAGHARAALVEDYGYVRSFPRSLIVDDTEAFARQLAGWAAWPYERLDTGRQIARLRSLGAAAPLAGPPPLRARLMSDAADWLEASYYCAQDTAVRLAIAIFGLPAFAMAIALGMVDGLVRRDLRKWSGGRESSFLYHHAKRFTGWFLGVGFAAYLIWPFGGVNPAALVLGFAAAVALSLSTTVSSFKKYL